MGYVHRWFHKIFVTGSSVLTIILIFALSYGSGSTPVAYRIVYMGFFLQYHLCYYFSRRLWKLFLYPFYVTLVIYSMCVLFAIYIYQFQQIQSMKTSQCFVHLSCELFLSSIGIRRAYQTRLGKELLTPAIFIVFIVMYIHFFHRQARKREISTPNYHEELPSIRILKIIRWLAVRFDRIQPILWRLLELFSYKIILLIVGFCLTRQTNINVTNFLLVCFFVISLLFPIFQGLAMGLYALVSALHILMIMIIRLELFVTLGEVTDVCYSTSSSTLCANELD